LKIYIQIIHNREYLVRSIKNEKQCLEHGFVTWFAQAQLVVVVLVVLHRKSRQSKAAQTAGGHVVHKGLQQVQDK
jgi:hypothetical protein